MNSAILKNIFRKFAPRLAGLTAAGGGLYGTAKLYDYANKENLQSPDSPNSQPRSRIMQAIVAANPNSTKLDALTNSKWPLESMFTYRDPKSNTYEDPISQEDFAYGRSEAANIQAELNAAREQAKREQAAMEQVAQEQAKKENAAINQSARDYAGWEQHARELAKKDQAKKDQAKWNRAATEQNEKKRDAVEQIKREQAANLIKNTPASPNNTPNNPTNTNVPNASQPSGTAAPTTNASVDDKASNNQNGSNSIAASLNNNPGYLMPTAIGQTLIAALLGRLLGGNTGMGLGAIMGLLASPLTASWLAKNNYLSNIAKPFSETEKGWFNNSK